MSTEFLPWKMPPDQAVRRALSGQGAYRSIDGETSGQGHTATAYCMTADASQQPVIDFLSDPASHGGAPVKRIDTHAALVFLTGERALKIKRAVRFPFLDFSTLKKRRAACEAEITVNRAFAPSIYRRVLPITSSPSGGLAVGGNGEPVEWAVEMRRFD